MTQITQILRTRGRQGRGRAGRAQAGGYDDFAAVPCRPRRSSGCVARRGLKRPPRPLGGSFGEITVKATVQREGPRLKNDESRGREFTPGEEADATGVEPVIIDATLAAQLFSTEGPEGRMLQFGAQSGGDDAGRESVRRSRGRRLALAAALIRRGLVSERAPGPAPATGNPSLLSGRCRLVPAGKNRRLISA